MRCEQDPTWQDEHAGTTPLHSRRRRRWLQSRARRRCRNWRSSLILSLPKDDVHANQIKPWRDQLLEGAIGVFGSEARPEPQAPTIDVKTLHAKLGELTLVNDPRSSREQAFWKARSARRAF
jgi:hypothetical protein